MEKVRLLPFVVLQLNDLIDILYYEEYVGFRKTALAYVTDLENFIYSIPNRKHKPCKNNKFGNYYCKYKRNAQTTWYIIFDTENDFYLVKYITNNHAKDYPLLIADFF